VKQSEAPLGKRRLSSSPVAGSHNQPGSMIEDAVLLPGRLLLRSRNYVRRLYAQDGLSAHEIGRRLGVSHSTVLEAVRVFGLNTGVRRNGTRKQKGQIPFGYVLLDCNLQKCPEEQAIIRLDSFRIDFERFPEPI
jgi:hypothetical protein